MNAQQARKLKVGDTVTAIFGNYRKKKCTILAIDWPVFTLRWKDCRGKHQERTRLYRSIWHSNSAPNEPKLDLPSWLRYDNESQDNHDKAI